MMMTKDRIGGLLFLCLSASYGYYAGQIPMLPGDEYEPFTARSLPTALAGLGGILSILLLLTSRASEEQRVKLSGLDFWLVAKLLVLVSLFAIALSWIGFLLSTMFFLMGGYYLLGERRIKILLLASVPFAVGIWFVLARLLGIYLAPGQLYITLFGG
ncbi:tripartite tricarboxylate transporter TctB family protein [Aestuariirhabdus sp. Z084]|uniref:tripartite tricarboxylate transporter TctB family protein n=1 Tax=Aestuariirhabdus haliotis TaxID=2918751 RepID=UPI00201B36CF|nr:tripartite tricarboxylate transporter TctB family protein [Aestuariirhabdus haliotis]MCL6414413.1 tripartite tricarboxylate transporter TctB family protein [Aestuariirhabdus haliotis]MCL6418345.1 tripartite tricarboxylate transporter TctB family protein [Aestuariirhabdus haliotis]